MDDPFGITTGNSVPLEVSEQAVMRENKTTRALIQIRLAEVHKRCIDVFGIKVYSFFKGTRVRLNFRFRSMPYEHKYKTIFRSSKL